jgi:hypothetical protein
MTPTELHLAYKKETGNYPSDNQEYIEWLENKLIELKPTQIKYKIDSRILTSIIKQKQKENEL